jgi:nicotinate-nucleotide adenylyltransferase
MKIGILGGSFNPPHLGHLLISLQVRDILGLDEIWLMPCYQHPFHKTLAPVEHRLAMTKFLANNSIKVSEYEITQNKQSYSIDTLSELTAKFPEHVFYWITGSDQLESFREYKDWYELIHKYNLVIFPREPVLPRITEKVKQDFHLQSIPKNITVLKSEELILTNISSTNIRQRIRNNEPITYMVPKKVEEYIKEHNLYEK